MTVILVDDGQLQVRLLLSLQDGRDQPTKPKRLIIALPVANKETATLLEQECDRLEIITKPSRGFRSMGQYYQDLGQTTDEQVMQIMDNRNR